MTTTLKVQLGETYHLSNTQLDGIESKAISIAEQGGTASSWFILTLIMLIITGTIKT